MVDESSIPVRFKGENFVWMKNPDGSGALAYPQHVDDDGHIKFMFCTSESFAHILADGRIVRHGSEIGSRDDLAFTTADRGGAAE